MSAMKKFTLVLAFLALGLSNAFAGSLQFKCSTPSTSDALIELQIYQEANGSYIANLNSVSADGLKSQQSYSNLEYSGGAHYFLVNSAEGDAPFSLKMDELKRNSENSELTVDFPGTAQLNCCFAGSLPFPLSSCN
jgi:hypothetical protein